jgi:uncharacterized protein (TIGR00661 family)
MPEMKKNIRKPRILVAPLDWGLGHATRCIPIIGELLKRDCEVLLAGEGLQTALLKTEFPHLEVLPLVGYRVRYPASGIFMPLKLLWQLPRLSDAIKEEHRWLKRKVRELKIDAVISDNRFGLYHKNIPCIFITHQLLIKSPWRRTEIFLQKMNYRHIRRFSECWVPDWAGEENLAGELSHPSRMPAMPVHFTGPLSRFTNRGIAEKKNHLLILLSGPEPQRTKLENIIVDQISRFNGSAVVVRGLPAVSSLIPSTGSILFYNHLPAEELNREMEKAEYIIARSGYSTIMDTLSLGKKCILIPTPGQTEQEYLARYLSGKKMVLAMMQKNFSLPEALRQASEFPFTRPPADAESPLPEIIHRFLLRLPSYPDRSSTNPPNV